MIDSSTIDPAVSRLMSEAANKKGAIFVDAPVSGGVNAAAAGTNFQVKKAFNDDFSLSNH